VAEWDELTQRAELDFSRGFLQFREYLEPGESALLTIRSAGQTPCERRSAQMTSAQINLHMAAQSPRSKEGKHP
jgi:hypothetical protein